MLVKLTTFFVLAFCAVISGQTTDDEIFQYLNLDYPGLQNVKEAYQKQDIKNARVALFTYFQNRTNRKFEWDKFDHDKDKADRNAKNIFDIKSLSYDFGSEIDWTVIQKDKEWQYTLNRMKWFCNYVGIYKKTGGEKYVQAWMEQIESWINMGDPGFPRTLDSGRRMEYWIISYLMFVSKLKSPSITPEFNARILFSMAQQADFLYNPDHWRRYSNWGTFENSGFSKFVLLFPEFKKNPRWLKEIYFRMDFQLSRSFHQDGMHIEVSPSYHSHELIVWFDFISLAKNNDIENPWHSQIPLTPLKELFYRRATALMNFYKPTGYVPQVGDTDRSDERHFLRKMGEFWEWPEMVYVASDGKEGTPPSTNSAAFPEGGYFIQRSGWGNTDLAFDQELYLLFDCGTNQPWHAHQDALSIVATAYGNDLLVDPGRYTYNDGPERDYFKSTAAHNTITVNNLNQEQYYTPETASWNSMCGFDYVVGNQSSYSGINHRRSVFFVKPNYWIVTDRITGTDTHTYNQYWHLSEKTKNQVRIEENGRKYITPDFVFLSPAEDLNLKMEKGFLSHSYLKKIEVPVMNYSFSGSPPFNIPSIIYPYQINAPDINCSILTVTDYAPTNPETDVIALKIISKNDEDIYIEKSDIGEVSLKSGIKTDARVAFISLDQDQNIRTFQIIDGTFLEMNGRRIIDLNHNRTDVSVLKDQLQIKSNCINSFSIYDTGISTIKFNSENIAINKEKEYIIFNKD
jgi:hypothetical protein